MTNSADPDQLASDLDLHCSLRQGMLCSAREGLNFWTLYLPRVLAHLNIYLVLLKKITSPC